MIDLGTFSPVSSRKPVEFGVFPEPPEGYNPATREIEKVKT